jgi:hypothetical protein
MQKSLFLPLFPPSARFGFALLHSYSREQGIKFRDFIPPGLNFQSRASDREILDWHLNSRSIQASLTAHCFQTPMKKSSAG